MLERLVQDELWELFQRVVPEAPTRPHPLRQNQMGHTGINFTN